MSMYAMFYGQCSLFYRKTLYGSSYAMTNTMLTNAQSIKN